LPETVTRGPPCAGGAPAARSADGPGREQDDKHDDEQGQQTLHMLEIWDGSRSPRHIPWHPCSGAPNIGRTGFAHRGPACQETETPCS